ncbi:MAG: xanthine dehydrogenase accessory factor [Gaiellales bacterium]|jgi:xanthine dehydrogenase accessory factor|nr:xanthine dehydrogenase accessory factor [Gaiellales bacterium]
MMRADLTHTADALRAARTPFVVATVVRVERPASAHPGDTAIVHPDGRIEGFVGGACATSTVRMQALRALETERPLLLRIQPDGGVAPAQPGIATVTNTCLSGGALEIFLEPQMPAPLVRVLGDSPVAESLRQLAPPLGFEVATGGVAEPTDDAVVIASLGHADEEAVEQALASGARYVALVASRRRGQAVVEGLRASGLCETRLDRLRTPAGLDIGARTHAEIALSILAQLVQERSLAEPAHAPADAPAGLVDPVCGMIEPPGAGWQRVEHDGVEYAFCCAGCRRRFEADPDRYLPALGVAPEG